MARGGRLLPVACEPVERRPLAVDGELAGLTGVDLMKMLVEQDNAEPGEWSPHRAWMTGRLHSVIIAHNHPQFGLPILVIDGASYVFLKPADDLGVERLSGAIGHA